MKVFPSHHLQEQSILSPFACRNTQILPHVIRITYLWFQYVQTSITWKIPTSKLNLVDKVTTSFNGKIILVRCNTTHQLIRLLNSWFATRNKPRPTTIRFFWFAICEKISKPCVWFLFSGFYSWKIRDWGLPYILKGWNYCKCGLYLSTKQLELHNILLPYITSTRFQFSTNNCQIEKCYNTIPFQYFLFGNSHCFYWFLPIYIFLCLYVYPYFYFCSSLSVFPYLRLYLYFCLSLFLLLSILFVGINWNISLFDILFFIYPQYFTFWSNQL